ncbi:RagB/SusD family nutrient uptake outer membrane protein [Chitinophaga horti]|uniref:RagB/SusD family nutrient uptake outer membrane protein n=1 Tax=Chitinophaga horti TaxID=2920382 RepID=A0ABY6J5T6_9BACT|nr:RagB/SusD family nutrient uptake outer membrane protein [Chitinophaga horti]UYQ94870.1 RagB/SusD family nutrient uptake outer membrane protein [Chitinophaga horti]
MKKLLFSTILLAALVGQGCKDYLQVEDPSSQSQVAVFNSVSYANSAVVGVYAMLIGDNAYGNRVSCLYPQSADDFKTSGSYNCDDRRGISVYGACNTNSELLNPFNQLYKGIERANVCIKYIPLSEPYLNGSAADKAAMRKLLGEALTLRAQFYHELVRNWGDLPGHFEPAADLSDTYLPKMDRDSIYDQVLADLEQAAEMVPWRTESPDQNLRLTKGAVKGLRARIALARGGYSLRREPRKMIRRDDYKKYYQIAYDECKAIMARRDQHTLNENYENIFRTLHTGNRLDAAHELMFEVGAFGGNASTDSKLGYYNGLKLDGNSKFGPGGGGIVALPTYFYEFDSIGDVRRDVTLAYYEIDKDSKKIMRKATDICDGKFRRSWTSITGTSQNLAINWPILRFADILLMFAEADNELNSAPSAEAIGALTEVRARAFKGNENRMGLVPADKEGFFKAVVQERLLEFGGEGIRKYDLLRWNMLAAKITETRAKLTEFMNGTGRYANVPVYVYTKAADFQNGPVPGDINTLDNFGGHASKVFFEPSVTTTPTGYSRRDWRAAVTQDFLTHPLNGYVIQFEENRKELYPLHNTVLNDNYKLKQDYGY